MQSKLLHTIGCLLQKSISQQEYKMYKIFLFRFNIVEVNNINYVLQQDF